MTEEKKSKRPKVDSEGQKELKRLEEKFDQFQKNVEALRVTNDESVPTAESESPLQKSQQELKYENGEYLKPKRTISSREKFNEKYRSDYDFKKEYVNFMAENKEIIGETIEMWTKAFPGTAAEFWQVPVNKPVWAPRYVAEQIKGAQYSVFVMDDNTVYDRGHVGDVDLQYHGALVRKKTEHRLDAHPVSSKKSFSSSF